MSTKGRIKKEIKKNKKSGEKVCDTVKKSARRKKVVVKKEVKVVKKKEKIKRKLYTFVDIQKAINAVNRGMSVRKAAVRFGVPPTSVHRAVKNPDKTHSKTGPPAVLSTDVENDIVHWIMYRAERGYPVSKMQLLDSVQSYVRGLGDRIPKTPFTNERPGRHWYEKFRARHPEITIRTPQHLSMTRASVTEEDLRGWFSEIEAYLQAKGLHKVQPSRIFNCDETNMQLIPKSEKVLTEKGANSVYKIVDGCEKESLTALFMYSADGTRAPPMLMFKYADSVPISILKNCPAGWSIGNSENGWMTTETFYEYIANVLYPWLLKNNVEFPIIIYLDGHSSHVTIPLVKFCRERQIELIALFPNATHIMQPLDIAFFHPFKEVWRATIIKYKAEHNISRLKKEHVPAVLEQALNSFDNEKKTIQNGFKAAGLVPLDPEAIEYNVLHKTKKKNKKDEPVQQPDLDNDTENMKKHLLTLENNLSNAKLESYKETEATGVWNNDTENSSLFQYWLEVKKAAGDPRMKLRPIIKNIECRPNFNITVVPHTVPASTPVESVNESDLNVTNDEILIELDNSIEQNEFNALFNNNSLESKILKTNNNTNELIDKHVNISDNICEPNITSSPNIWEDLTPENVDYKMCQKENLHESANSINELNDSEVISAVSYDQVQEFTSPRVINKKNSSLQVTVQRTDNSDKMIDDQFERIFSPQNENVLPVLQENVQKICKQINNESSDLQDNQENISIPSLDSGSISDQRKSFANAFTLPPEYLPKKKRAKLGTTGKSKLPSVGTSDEWWKAHMEKEQAQKIKEEQKAKRKSLQEEKKKLAEAKKKYMREMQEKMNEIQKKIKREKE